MHSAVTARPFWGAFWTPPAIETCAPRTMASRHATRALSRLRCNGPQRRDGLRDHAEAVLALGAEPGERLSVDDADRVERHLEPFREELSVALAEPVRFG